MRVDTTIGLEQKTFTLCENGELKLDRPVTLDHLDAPEFADVWRDVLEDKVCLS